MIFLAYSVTQTTTTTDITTTTELTTTTDVATVTSSATTTVTNVAKRDVSAPNNAITYGPSRLSSACSCLITKPGTNTGTIKATATAQVTSTTSATITSKATLTESSTSTAVVTSTVTVAGQSCFVNGYGTAQYSLATGSAADAVSPATCKAFCQRTPNCVSFGQGAGQCAAYTVSAKINARPQTVQTPYYFSDVTCNV